MWKWLRGSSGSKPDDSASELPKATATDKGLAPAGGRQLFGARKSLRVVLGLDFGTSCSKLAYRVLGGNRVVRFLHLGESGLDDPTFCYTSTVMPDSSGEPLFGNESGRASLRRPADSGIRRLKVLVAGGVDKSFRDVTLLEQFHRAQGEFSAPWRDLDAALWLCLVLVDHFTKAISQIELWEKATVSQAIVQLPIPLPHREHAGASAVYDRVRHTCSLAVQALGEDRTPSPRKLLEVVCEAWERSVTGPPSDAFSFVVECQAQIAGYLTSLRAQRGVHGVVDIGAGTTDVAIFDLRGTSAAEARTYWYAARSLPAGAAAVEKIAAEWGGARRTRAEALRLLSAPEQMPPGLAEAVVKWLREAKQNTNWAWAAAYGHSKQASRWQGVPIFLSGGGSMLPGVRDVFGQSWVPNWPALDVRILPLPSDVQFLDGEGAQFHRLSTAYGLTFLLPELPDFVPPSQAPDMTPPRNILDWVPDIHPLNP